MQKLFKIVSNISISKLSSALLAVGALMIFYFGFVNADREAKMFAAQGVNEHQAQPGETLHYQLTIINEGNVDLTNVYVAENFSPYVDYVLGSTTATKAGSTIQVVDDWVNTGVNIGTLIPTSQANLNFDAKIKADAPIGGTIETTSQIKSDQTPDWIQRAVQTIIVDPNVKTTLQGGDFFKLTNNTWQNGWRDETQADAYNVIEFFVKMTNTGENEARDITFYMPFSSTPSTHLQPAVQVWADNADKIEDSVDIYMRDGSSTILIYKVGYARLFGNTGLYNCPNGCEINESFYLEPLGLGNLQPGESAAVQVIFKADLVPLSTPTPTPTATPTPTPTPTVTPTPTPSVTPTPTPTASSTPSTTPSPILGASTPPQLPKTGGSFLAFGLVGGLAILGIKLMRKFKLA